MTASIAIFRFLIQFIKDAFSLSNRMDNLPSLRLGDRIIGKDDIEYTLNEIRETEMGHILIFSKSQFPQPIVIGEHKYSVELDGPLAPGGWYLKRMDNDR